MAAGWNQSHRDVPTLVSLHLVLYHGVIRLACGTFEVQPLPAAEDLENGRGST